MKESHIYITSLNLAVYLENRYLNAADTDFVNLVTADIANYQKTATPDRVLVFPPVDNYYRFLIHKTVEEFPDLHSFSVGAGDDRRTVVCLQLSILRVRQMDSCDNVPENVARIQKTLSMKQPQWDHGGYHQEEATGKKADSKHAKHRDGQHQHIGESRTKSGQQYGHSPQRSNPSFHGKESVEPEHQKSGAAAKSRNKGRRPDLQVYVPRAKRLQQDDSLDGSSKSCSTGDTSQETSERPDSVTTEKPPRKQKHRTRPSLEPYIPRPRRTLEQAGSHGVSQTVSCNTSHQSGEMLQRRNKHNQIDTGDVQVSHRLEETESSNDHRQQCELKNTSNLSVMQNDDLRVGTDKHSGHRRSRRKHHSRDKEVGDEARYSTKERKHKHHSKSVQHDKQQDRVANSNMDNTQEPIRSSQDNKQSEEGKNILEDESLLNGSEENTSEIQTKDLGLPPNINNTLDLNQEDADPDGDDLYGNKTSNSPCATRSFTDSSGINFADADKELPVKLASGAERLCTVKPTQPMDEEMTRNMTSSHESLTSMDTNQIPANDINQITTENEIVRDDMEVECLQSDQRDHSCSTPAELNVKDAKLSTLNDKAPCDQSDIGVSSDDLHKLQTASNVQSVVLEGDLILDKTDVKRTVICPEMDQSETRSHSAPQEVSQSGDSLDDVCSDKSHESVKMECIQLSEVCHSDISVQNDSVIISKQMETSESERSTHDDMLHNLTQSDKNQPEISKQDGTSDKLTQREVTNLDNHAQDTAADKLMQSASTESLEDDSWDKLYDDSGEALDAKLMEELTAAVGNVQVQKPEFDYYNYQPKDPDLDYDAYSHLVEIYNFPSSLITRDLVVAFKEFEDSGFDIKWVDDNHAIGIFSSAFAARSALTLKHPLIKVRPLCEATRQTKVKAKKSSEFLQPYRPRPETVASVARNLVAGALGIRPKVPKEKREEERSKLRDARERKRLSTKEKRDAWNGVIGHCAMDDI